MLNHRHRIVSYHIMKGLSDSAYTQAEFSWM